MAQHHASPNTMLRRWGKPLAIGWWGLLIWLVLRPLPSYDPVSCWVVCPSSLFIDVVANLVAFGIAAFLFVRVGGPALMGVVAGCTLAVAAEVLQGTFLQGRDPSLVDVLTGALGTMGGALLATTSSAPRPRLRTVMLMGAWLAWLGWSAAAVWAFLPAVGSGPYLVILTPAGRAAGIEVTATTANGRFFIDGSFEAPEPGGYRTLAVIVDRTAWVAEVAVSWRGLVFGTQTRGHAIGAPVPGFHLIRTLPPTGGDRVTFSAWRSNRTWHLEASRPGWSGTVDGAPYPLWGWALLYPGRYAMGWERHVFTAIYCLGWALLLGLVTRWAEPGPSPLLRAAGLGIIAAGLGLVPALMGSTPSTWWHWILCAGGFALGLVVGPGSGKEARVADS